MSKPTTTTQARNTADLTTRPLFGKIVLFALPLLCSSLLQLLYNAADLIVVGQWSGDTAMAAVGSTGALVNLIIMLFVGLSTGALAVTARYIGAKRADKVGRCVHTSILLSVLCGTFVGVLGFFISKPLLRLMNSPEGILNQSALYLKIYFCGMPFNLLYNFGAAILRAGGDTRRPLLILGCAGLLNVGLNILTVAGFDMGVAGVAIATVASQAVSAVGVLFFLSRKKDDTRFGFRKLRIHKTELAEILRVGVPAGLQSTLFALSNVIIQSSINGFGAAAVAGSAAAANLEAFVYASMNAVTQSCLTVVGQNYGAAKPKNIDLAMLQCLALTVCVGLGMAILVYAAGRPLLRFYGCTGEGIAFGLRRLRIICLWYFLCGMMEIPACAMQGMGRSLLAMLVTMFGACVSRVVWVYTVFRVRPTFFVLMISYPLSWILTFCVHAVCLLCLRRKVYPLLRNAQASGAEQAAPSQEPEKNAQVPCAEQATDVRETEENAQQKS